MKTFIGRELREDGNWYSVEIGAETFADAQRIADGMGCVLDGELMATIPADDTTREQMDEMVDAMNNRETRQ